MMRTVFPRNANKPSARAAGTAMVAAILTLLSGCADAGVPVRPEAGSSPVGGASTEVGSGIAGIELTGVWRAVLASPGGELPFTLRVSPPRAPVPAVAINGEEEVPFTSLKRDGNQVILTIDGYDSRITAEIGHGGDTMTGVWTKTAEGGGESRLAFAARRGLTHRFSAELPAAAGTAFAGEAPAATARTAFTPDDTGSAGSLPLAPDAVVDVNGVWSVAFTDTDGIQPARAELRQDGHDVTGTFLTPVGDYRYLEGDYRSGFLRLSCFDGGHAFLFHARATAGGGLAGDFWSRDSYHATWTAAREDAAGPEALPDPFTIVRVVSADRRLHFTFPDLDGNPVSLADERFAGKVVVVVIFGSWCPNCNDEAPILARWHHRYRDRGLEMVGLAYELTGEAQRDGEFVRRYGERHGIEFPLLLAGTSDKDAASLTLPDLSRVAAYPTTIFVGRDGTVRQVHSGFAGPATGRHHAELRQRFESLLEALLAESAPDFGGG